jgi:hypothetical protein
VDETTGATRSEGKAVGAVDWNRWAICSGKGLDLRDSVNAEAMRPLVRGVCEDCGGGGRLMPAHHRARHEPRTAGVRAEAQAAPTATAVLTAQAETRAAFGELLGNAVAAAAAGTRSDAGRTDGNPAR